MRINLNLLGCFGDNHNLFSLLQVQQQHCEGVASENDFAMEDREPLIPHSQWFYAADGLATQEAITLTVMVLN